MIEIWQRKGGKKGQRCNGRKKTNINKKKTNIKKKNLINEWKKHERKSYKTRKLH